jgi:sporulation protein YlmC with PRC-barrel domain
MTATTEVEGASLISADRVEGTPVYNTRGEKLGHVEDVMLHKLSGKVAYAVVSCGGFLGLGEKYLPMPWSLLTYDTSKNGYVVPTDRAQLEAAASFEAAREDDTSWRERVHTHYDAPAYWG